MYDEAYNLAMGFFLEGAVKECQKMNI